MKNKILSILACSSIIANQSFWLIPETKASFEPYQKTFIVTAYYSPLPGQNFYVTGSLASDKRLNGNGTHGADGTPVYPGMIAAPGTYSFGTRISCPGYIDGEIHDRGGAIVKAGVRNNAHDRLDFWAGHGDEALKTALYWGKRTLTCTVYPPNHSPAEQYVTLPQGKLSDFAKTFLKKPQTSTPVAQSSDVIPTHYQELLKDLGYDPSDKASRIAFQTRHEIISSETDASAGNIGPGTKAKLDQIRQESHKEIPAEGLEEGTVSSDVRLLQEMLVEMGYLDENPTAIFGEKTKQALIQFQLEKGIIDSKDHAAAGYVGPGTHSALKKSSLEKYLISANDQVVIAKLKAQDEKEEAIALADELALHKPNENEEAEATRDEFYELLKTLSDEWVKEHTPSEEGDINASAKPEIQLASTKIPDNLSEVKAILEPIFNPFDHSLKLGSKHSEVEKMQILLKNNGYFEGEMITDYFGPQTKKAIAQFQVDYKIVASIHHSEAGIVGPKTIKALNALYYQNEFSLPREVTGKIRAPAIHPSDITIKDPVKQASLNGAKS
jgi:peptidoglycan hydrolase-like protein with peptidoglycan-binding domain